MKILFLDIDGVLATDKSCELPRIPFPDDFHIPFNDGWTRLDESCIDRFNQIIDSTGAKIVLSSSWRLAGDEHVIDYLKSQGIDGDFIDYTPIHYYERYPENDWNDDVECWGIGRRINNRREEISYWFEGCAPIVLRDEIESFVILDDERYMGDMSSSHVCTEESIGIQDCDVKKAIKILNG